MVIKEAKLILDNNAHKCSITIDGKQQKIAIAPFDEMSLTEANAIIRQVNDIMNAAYDFPQIVKMLEVSEKLPTLSRYSSKALHIVIKLIYQEDLQKYIDSKQVEDENEDIQRALVILNIGCTSVGKTLGNLYALIPYPYVKNFLPLASIKESTNFPIYFIVNSYDKKLEDREEFEIEFNLKTTEKIKEDVDSLVVEALQEILDTIKSEVKSNSNNGAVWELALNAGCERLRINKDKTFDITNSVEFNDEHDLLEKILIQSIKDYSTKSSSYNDKLSNAQMKDDIINDFRENIFKITIDEIAYIIQELDEFIRLVEDIFTQLQNLLNIFKNNYGIEIVDKHPISIRKRLDDRDTKKLISNIFGDKKQRQDKEFYSIDALVSDAKLFFQNNLINNGEQLIVVDGLGINQGQIAKGTEKKVAYNRIHSAIQQCNPDLILYNTRLDSKDDYIIDVIKDLNEQGYKNRVFVVYGRVDTVLESYCDEEDIVISDMQEAEFSKFKRYINTEYLDKELISLGNMEREKVYLCDKPCKLSKYSSEHFREYTPYQVLSDVLDTFKLTEKTERTKLNKVKIEKIIDIMDDCLIFNNAFRAFKDSIDDMVPMVYNLLRWNTLECGIRSLFYNGLGYASLYPSITLKNCYAKLLNCDEVKAIFEDAYDDILKELLNQWTNLAHILMVTSYRSEFSKLLAMRFDSNIRTMKSMTLTDERKYIVRNILYTCFENGTIDGKTAFREITKHVLANIMY